MIGPLILDVLAIIPHEDALLLLDYFKIDELKRKAMRAATQELLKEAKKIKDSVPLVEPMMEVEG